MDISTVNNAIKRWGLKLVRHTNGYHYFTSLTKIDIDEVKIYDIDCFTMSDWHKLSQNLLLRRNVDDFLNRLPKHVGNTKTITEFKYVCHNNKPNRIFINIASFA